MPWYPSESCCTASFTISRWNQRERERWRRIRIWNRQADQIVNKCYSLLTTAPPPPLMKLRKECSLSLLWVGTPLKACDPDPGKGVWRIRQKVFSPEDFSAADPPIAQHKVWKFRDTEESADDKKKHVEKLLTFTSNLQNMTTRTCHTFKDYIRNPWLSEQCRDLLHLCV